MLRKWRAASGSPGPEEAHEHGLRQGLRRRRSSRRRRRTGTSTSTTTRSSSPSTSRWSRAGRCSWRASPGSGKSSLAPSVARLLGRRFYREVISSRTEARDLLWQFDALARLRDAQASAPRSSWTRRTTSSPACSGAPSTARRRPSSCPTTAGRRRRRAARRDRQGRPRRPQRPARSARRLPVPWSRTPGGGRSRRTSRIRWSCSPPTTSASSPPRSPAAASCSCSSRRMRPATGGSPRPTSRTATRTCTRNLASLLESLAEQASEQHIPPPSTAEYLDAIRSCQRLGVSPGHPAWDAVAERDADEASGAGPGELMRSQVSIGDLVRALVELDARGEDTAGAIRGCSGSTCRRVGRPRRRWIGDGGPLDEPAAAPRRATRRDRAGRRRRRRPPGRARLRARGAARDGRRSALRAADPGTSAPLPTRDRCSRPTCRAGSSAPRCRRRTTAGRSTSARSSSGWHAGTRSRRCRVAAGRRSATGLRCSSTAVPAWRRTRRTPPALLAEIQRHVGAERLAVARFAGCPTRGAGSGPRRRWGAWRPPRPGMPIAVISDLGHRPPAAVGGPGARGRVGALRADAEHARCPVVAFVPYRRAASRAAAARDLGRRVERTGVGVARAGRRGRRADEAAGYERRRRAGARPADRAPGELALARRADRAGAAARDARRAAPRTSTRAPRAICGSARWSPPAARPASCSMATTSWTSCAVGSPSDPGSPRARLRRDRAHPRRRRAGARAGGAAGVPRAAGQWLGGRDRRGARLGPGRDARRRAGAPTRPLGGARGAAAPGRGARPRIGVEGAPPVLGALRRRSRTRSAPTSPRTRASGSSSCCPRTRPAAGSACGSATPGSSSPTPPVDGYVPLAVPDHPARDRHRYPRGDRDAPGRAARG